MRCRFARRSSSCTEELSVAIVGAESEPLVLEREEVEGVWVWWPELDLGSRNDPSSCQKLRLGESACWDRTSTSACEPHGASKDGVQCVCARAPVLKSLGQDPAPAEYLPGWQGSGEIMRT